MKKESEIKKESDVKQEKPEEEVEEEKKETPMELEEEAMEEEEEEEEDDVDPLDAYMEGVKEEVKKFNMGGMRGNDKVSSEGRMIWKS
jgi:ATP-dependent RNA helicase DDX46/PRP5